MVQSYFDNAGLYQKYGVDQATPKVGGEYRTNAQLREIELKINLASLTQTNTIIDDTVFFPAGMIIQQVIVETTVAGATGTAINIGLMRTDRSTVTDATAFVAALPQASMTPAGKQTTFNVGSTYAGTMMGATTASVNYITAQTTSATAFTAGVLVVKIQYYKP